MTNEEIKEECELMYLHIKNAENRLNELRSVCNHQKTFQGNYSWRVGSILPAIICEYCGKLIKYVYSYSFESDNAAPKTENK